MQNLRFSPIFIVIFILLLTVFFSFTLEVNYLDLFYGLSSLKLLYFDITPIAYGTIQVALISTYETIQIAFLGTVFGAILSLPLAIFSARNLFSIQLNSIFRTILAGIRTLPALIWAIMFVMIVGLGPLAGILATTAYTIGYLSKMFYESLEGIDPESMYAVKSLNISKVQLIQHIVLPEAGNSLLSHILYIFEYNIRGSAILGFVGAGGVGFYISAYLKLLEYDKIFVILAVLFIVVLVIDYLSTKIRDNYLIK
jgi:phosphonate transport system permease protein